MTNTCAVRHSIELSKLIGDLYIDSIDIPHGALLVEPTSALKVVSHYQSITLP